MGMDMLEAEYKDKIILALRQKYVQKQVETQDVGASVWIGTKKEPLCMEWLFQEKCSMLLPECLTDMGEAEAAARYRSINRPQIIKAQKHGDAVLTFSLIAMEECGEKLKVTDRLARLRQDMKKLWKQNVFYDTGIVQAGELEIPWMDMRGFCLNGSFYSLMFLFEIDEDVALGNFHCGFPQYDIWKPVMLKLLTTIKI